MHRNKAVAVGAISLYAGHVVTGRISRFTYGTVHHVSYEPLNPEHVKREHKTFLDASGDRRVPGYFDIMLLGVCHLPPFLSVVLDVLIIYRRVLRF